jgi:hypothetical protein
MKFNKLVKIINESLGSPKNKGGARVYNAQQSDGPSGYSSSPVGKTDALEVAKPSDRWEFNPLKGGNSGLDVGSKAYNAMFTSFGLLANDKGFVENFNEISKTFGKKRAAYNNSRTVETDTGKLEKEKYDYEKKLDNLEFMKAKRAAQVTELKDRKKHFERRISDWERYTKSPLQKNRLKVLYAGLSATIKEIESQNKRSKNNNFFEIKQIYKDIEQKERDIKKLNHEIFLTKDENKKKQIQSDIDRLSLDISKLSNSLNGQKYSKDLLEFKKYRKYLRKMNSIEEKHTNSELDTSTINREAKEVLDLSSRIDEMEEKYQDVVDELTAIYDHVDQINSINQEADRYAQESFKELVISSAKRVLSNLNVANSPINLQSLSQLKWDDLPKSNKQKIEKLQALTSDNLDLNPILGFLNRFQRAYDNREYNSSLQLNKNTNITSLRDFESLPFSIMMKIYKGVATKNAIKLSDSEYDETRNDVWNVLKTYLKAFNGLDGADIFDNTAKKRLDSSIGSPEMSDISPMIPKFQGKTIRQVWSSPDNIDFIKRQILDSGLPDIVKNRLLAFITSPRERLFGVSRTGANSFMTLLSMVNSDVENLRRNNESFEKTYSNIISEKVWDDDDFKLNVMEVLSLVSKSK